MFGYGTLSVQAAVNRCRKLSRGASVLLVGDFTDRNPDHIDEGVRLQSAAEVRSVEPWGSDDSVPVLILHDDTLISRSALARLHRTHQHTGQPTVPWTNDIGTDHDMGALPIDVASERELDTVRPPDESTSLTTAATAIVATREQAISILHLGISDAATRLLRPEFVVAKAVASHIGSCLVVEESGEMPDAPLLVASMIVKNEGKVIERCLQSLTEIVDRIEIVDTGSTDDTVAKCLALGAVVSHFPWQDDFAKARNVALDRCRDARYVLIVDADEVAQCADPQRLRSFLGTDDNEHDTFKVMVNNVGNDATSSGVSSVRIAPTTDTRWVGRVHEMLTRRGDLATLNGPLLEMITFDHFGYQQASVTEKGKRQRNLDLAEAAHLANPDFKTRFDLARTLAWQPDTTARAVLLFQEALSDPGDVGAPALAYAEANIAADHLAKLELDRAAQRAERAIDLCSGEFLGHLVLAKSWEMLGHDTKIAEAHRIRTTSKLARPIFGVDTFRAQTDSITVGALTRLGRVEEAIALTMQILSDRSDLFGYWADLANGLAPGVRLDILSRLIQVSDHSGFVDQLKTAIPPGELAELILIHTSKTRPPTEALITGIMAAVVADNASTAAQLARIASGGLTSDQAAVIADRVRQRGMPHVAAILEEPLLV